MRNVFVYLILLVGIPATVAGLIRLGAGTQPRTMLSRQEQPTKSIFMDYAVLELQGDEFRYWHFSDMLGFSQHPVSGTFTREGVTIELVSNKLASSQKRYVTTTINGVAGTWAENELEAWRVSECLAPAPAPLRVATGSASKSLALRKGAFSTLTSMFDGVVAQKYWTGFLDDNPSSYYFCLRMN